jgi:hypothetical protein
MRDQQPSNAQECRDKGKSMESHQPGLKWADLWAKFSFNLPEVVKAKPYGSTQPKKASADYEQSGLPSGKFG